MTRTTLRFCARWALPALLALPLLVLAGCSSQSGSRCYAEAVPSSGEGGLAWGGNLSSARSKSIADCRLYASRSGGTPGTCKVVLEKCK